MSVSDKLDYDEKESVDIYSYHEKNAGRLIIDPKYVAPRSRCPRLQLNYRFYNTREAQIELGEEIASKLKLTKDGTKILWPQPTDSPLDPQNWSEREKTIHLIILILVSIVPDFDSGLGKATLGST